MTKPLHWCEWCAAFPEPCLQHRQAEPRYDVPLPDAQQMREDQPMSPTHPVVEEQRAWEAKVCHWLGLDSAVSIRVQDNFGTLARPKPQSEPARLTVHMIANARTLWPKVAKGELARTTVEGGIDPDINRVTLDVVLTWGEEQHLLAEVGPRPPLLTLEQERRLDALRP